MAAKIIVVAVGRGDPEYAPQVRRYVERVRFRWTLDILEVKEERGGQAAEAATIMRAEARRIDKVIPPRTQRIALSPEGREYDSPGFAAELTRRLERPSGIVFIVGGAFGLAPEIREEADLNLSLSRMTFPHQLARVLLLEQIYRATSLMAGTAYHK